MHGRRKLLCMKKRARLFRKTRLPSTAVLSSLEPRRHEEHEAQGTETSIMQNRVTVLHKAAFSFAVSRQMKISPTFSLLPW
jgi:hypothetical protein